MLLTCWTLVIGGHWTAGFEWLYQRLVVVCGVFYAYAPLALPVMCTDTLHMRITCAATD